MRIPALGARLGLMGTLAVLGACAHQASQSPTSAPSGAAAQVGYVSLDRLVKKHPMYGQLASYDADIQALQLKAVTTSVAVSPADLERAKVEMQQELDAAVARTKDTLKEKAGEMQTRENAAISAAIAAAAPGSGGSISGGINQQLAAQQQQVREDAAKDFDAYRKQVIAQDEASLRSLEESYNAQAAREYRAKANALQAAESTFALKLADDDKADRLSLRTRLSNLPLDDAERESTRAQLDAIDRKESDQIGQLRNRDQQTLSDLQLTLHSRVKREVDVAVASIKSKSVAKIDAHLKTTQQLVDAASGGSVTQTASTANLPPDMQARIKALQDRFQLDFNAERDRTLADLDKTRRDLSAKFERLTGVDREADASTQKEIVKLQKTRTDLYDSMTAEIQREIRIVAQKRGIDVVFSDVVAPAGGVDLTVDAEKDIESLPK